MKSGKRHPTDGMELPNQEKIRTLGEKETNKHLRTLEAVTIKKKLRKVSKENPKATRDKTIWQKPYQRNTYLGCFPRKLFGTILEVDQRWT